MRKIPTSLLLVGLFVLLAGVTAVAIITGILPIRDILTSFYTFVFILVLISILGIIGALFLGMFISHRVFSSREFNVFEEEMLKMKRDVEYIKEKIEEMEDD